MSNHFENLDNRDEFEGGRTARPPLHLKTSPGIGSRIDDDLEEMVPEFMHRGFYRSEEELSPVETGAKLKPLRRKSSKPTSKPIDLFDREPDEDLDNDSVLDTVVVEHSEQESFEPLRKVAVPEPALYPSKPSGPGPLPRPVETKNLSLPLLIGFLLVVGLFLWREQTRPSPAPNEPLAVPRTVTVAEAPKVEANPDLLGESPYPVNEATPLAQPRKVNEAELLPPTVAEERTEESDETIPAPIPEINAGNMADREREAQREAILSRVSDGTVSRGQSDARSSSSVAPGRAPRIPESLPPAPAEDLFPDVPEAGADTGPAPIPPAPEDSEVEPEKKPYKRQPLEERVQVDPADMAPIPPSPPRRPPVAAQVEPERTAPAVVAPPSAPVAAPPVIEPIPELPSDDTNYEISEPTL